VKEIKLENLTTESHIGERSCTVQNFMLIQCHSVPLPETPWLYKNLFKVGSLIDRKLFLMFLFLFSQFFVLLTYGQVRIRLFSSQSPESATFSVTGGSYVLNTFSGSKLTVRKNESVLITRYNGHLAIKSGTEKGFMCDSLTLSGTTGNDRFSLRINGSKAVRQFYSGDLQCFPDLGTILMINTCSVETYIAGVVQAEGGRGQGREYFKTQAILARTYLYKYFEKHLPDRYNVCDNTHCQAYSGLSGDSLISRAALETRGLVVLDSDGNLVISAFHSNCGGETSDPVDVWLTGMPYLKKKADPNCITSHNAAWEKRISLKDWVELMQRHGYQGRTGDPSVFSYTQKSRQYYYKIGAFTMPLNSIRSELNLRSTFFSVVPEGDSVILKGRGYGHGVGLCQEGAMSMAARGSSYRQIIDFYYSGIIITDIKNAAMPLSLQFGAATPKPPEGGL
jgi:stage II sporulation protein D